MSQPTSLSPEPLKLADFARLCDCIRTNRYSPRPPDTNFAGGDYVNVGVALLKVLVSEGLEPGQAIIDIGSGLGRLAVPLTQYLTSGRYVGIDINLAGISWCHENIQKVYENFEFILIDAFNNHYRNRAEYGQSPMEKVLIPKQKAASFDMACAFSLFTHLTQTETIAYIKQIGHLLKPGGKFVSSWFFLDEHSIEAVENGSTRWKFKLARGGPDYFLSEDSRVYSQAIGYNFEFVIDLAKANGLFLNSPPTRGQWRAGKDGQDLVCFYKPIASDGVS